MPGYHESLKRAIRAARQKQGIESDQQLALAAGVHLQTLQNWMYGKTTPRPHELSKVAAVLDVPLADLMAVYEGRDPEPPPLQDAIRELVEEMREDRTQRHDEMNAMVSAINALLALLGNPPRLAG